MYDNKTYAVATRLSRTFGPKFFNIFVRTRFIAPISGFKPTAIKRVRDNAPQCSRLMSVSETPTFADTDRYKYIYVFINI